MCEHRHRLTHTCIKGHRQHPYATQRNNCFSPRCTCVLSLRIAPYHNTTTTLPDATRSDSTQPHKERHATRQGRVSSSDICHTHMHIVASTKLLLHALFGERFQCAFVVVVCACARDPHLEMRVHDRDRRHGEVSGAEHRPQESREIREMRIGMYNPKASQSGMQCDNNPGCGQYRVAYGICGCTQLKSSLFASSNQHTHFVQL